jgi:hypothetical protein
MQRVTEVERLVCGGAHATFLLQAVHVLSVFAGKAIAIKFAGPRTSVRHYLPAWSWDTLSVLLRHADDASPIVSLCVAHSRPN